MLVHAWNDLRNEPDDDSFVIVVPVDEESLDAGVHDPDPAPVDELLVEPDLEYLRVVRPFDSG